ncbi:dol-P-Man:Man(5)GlcNAc(2)-PP-Dol alpha-1,3-mannosyltransferase-like isoform X3 [Gossypium arboreum]|uniref:dol-P-Man:Man(5)GlcNAc(2)-PP-Dol alpha-1,3-mannosyltransferase-like isoform X3 n=1 Tax=Gossypium arboreum TaxID=29729 RepID=UPI0022F17831|nr:dol-P-Man:Man(5)GlcNAc(2)-PP-Dol alpha-1,3-mannosyltransferase-like isoform X3 [Gossypium arboreum]
MFFLLTRNRRVKSVRLHQAKILVLRRHRIHQPRHEGGLFKFLRSRISFCSITSCSAWPKTLKKEHIVTTMFVGNFIGIIFDRSLHYQFYSWYFYTLPHLLWITPFPTLLRVLIFVGIELCWNVFPSNLEKWKSQVRCSFMNFSRNTRCLKCKAKGPKRVATDDVQMKKGDWNCPGNIDTCVSVLVT